MSRGPQAPPEEGQSYWNYYHLSPTGTFITRGSGVEIPLGGPVNLKGKQHSIYTMANKAIHQPVLFRIRNENNQ